MLSIHFSAQANPLYALFNWLILIKIYKYGHECLYLQDKPSKIQASQILRRNRLSRLRLLASEYFLEAV